MLAAVATLRLSVLLPEARAMVATAVAAENAWIERFWRTIKKDYLYLNPAETFTEHYQQIKHYITGYNNRFCLGIKTKPNILYGQEARILALAS